MSIDINQAKMDFTTLVLASRILDDAARLRNAMAAGKQKSDEIGHVLDAMPGLRRKEKSNG